MRSFLLNFAAIFCFLFLTACSENCDDRCRQRVWDRGFSAGETSGYNRGHDIGYRAGYSEGEEVGFKNGFSKGEEEGYSKGRQSGYRSGYLTGSGSYIQDNVFPVLGIAVLLAFALFATFYFSKAFNKSIGDTTRDLLNLANNFFVRIKLRSLSRKINNTQKTRAEVLAKVHSLKIYSEVAYLIEDMKIEQDFYLIVAKIEQYLKLMNFQNHDAVYKNTLQAVYHTSKGEGLSQPERSQLLELIELLLSSQISKASNLLDLEKKSLKELRKSCHRLIRNRQLHRCILHIKGVLVACSIILNFLVVGGVFYLSKNTDQLESFLSFFNSITSSFLAGGGFK